MALQPNTFEYNLLFVLVIILIIFKLLITIYFATVVIKKKKETGELSFDFSFGMFVLMLCLFLSRLVYLYYDFYCTQFDPDTFIDPYNLFVWKIATTIYAIGFATILFTIDKVLLEFKLKGILSYIIIINAIIILLYPVRTQQDFILINGLSAIGALVGVLIPIIFIYLGNRTPNLRKPAYMIAFGVIIFTIGALLVIQPILDPLINIYGDQVQILMFFLFFILKIIGLSLFSNGVIKFKL
jgi:hypothetical protein